MRDRDALIARAIEAHTAAILALDERLRAVEGRKEAAARAERRLRAWQLAAATVALPQPGASPH